MASAFDNPAILRGFADKFPFGFYVVDPERTILYWNEAAERITGYHAQEVVGRCCADDLLVHCGPQGGALCATDGCPFTFTLRDGKPAEEHLYLRHKEGQRIPVRILALPMLDAHGAIVAIAELFVEENNSPEGLCWITETASRRRSAIEDSICSGDDRTVTAFTFAVHVASRGISHRSATTQ